MSRTTKLFLAVALTVTTVSAAFAAPIIRNASLFETHAIEGVSLGMSPQEAFTLLYTNGYRAGDITTYEEWTEGSINLVRGTYGGPEGQSSVNLGRADGRLALISQSLNRPGIDVAAEIGAAQSHFGIAADEKDCKVNTTGTGGSCQVRDAEERADATMIFTMTVQPTMILRSISRPKELVNTL